MASVELIFITTIMAVLAVTIVGRSVDITFPTSRPNDYNDYEYKRTKGGYSFKLKKKEESAALEDISYQISGHLYIYPPYFILDLDGCAYKYDAMDGNTREEVGVIVFPDTPREHLVVMGTYTVFDNKTNIETMTLYTADENGYKTRVSITNRLGPTALKSTVG